MQELFRTERSKHFISGSGKRIAEIGNHSHYRDWSNGGVWATATLDDVLENRHGWQRNVAKQKMLGVAVGENPNALGRNRDLVELFYNDGLAEHWVTVKSLKPAINGNPPQRNRSGNFEINDSGLRLKTVFNERRVWRSYEFTKASDLADVFETSYALGPTLAPPTLNPTGDISINFLLGGEFLRIHKPFLMAVFPDRVIPAFNFDHVSYSIGPRRVYGKDCWVITKTVTQAGMDWLEAQLNAGADYVAVDPTTTLQPDSSGVDNLISFGEPTTNYNSLTLVGVGDTDGAGNQDRSTLIKFDLSSIPTSSTIQTATMSLFEYDASDTASVGGWTLSLYDLLVSFSETTSSWNNRQTATAWNTAGARGSGTDRAVSASSTLALDGTAANAFVDFTGLASLVQGWLTTNNGCLIEAPAAGLQGSLLSYNLFRSSDYTTAADRPKLYIEYSAFTPKIIFI